MKHEIPRSRNRDELEIDLASGDIGAISTALVSAALHDSDRSYVESLIVRFIHHDDPWVRGVSALAAGHIARIHGQISEGIVLLVKELLKDEANAGRAEDALDDINRFAAQKK